MAEIRRGAPPWAEPATRVTGIVNALRRLEAHKLVVATPYLGEAAPDYTAYARLCNELHEQLLQLSGNLVLREMTDLLHYRAARVWLAFLPNVDWKEALGNLESEIADTIRALELDDMQGVGNVRRQYLYALLKTIGRYFVGV